MSAISFVCYIVTNISQSCVYVYVRLYMCVCVRAYIYINLLYSKIKKP